MPEQQIEDFIGDVLTGDAQANAHTFVAYLRANGMQFERGKGYWENKLYWLVTYKNEYVCFVLLNDAGEKDSPWIIWSDDSGSCWFEDAPLDERTKEIAWQNIDFCANCGSNCSLGTRKTVFGKAFDHVCRTTLRFDNPDAEALACAMKMAELRKNDIEKKQSTVQKAFNAGV